MDINRSKLAIVFLFLITIFSCLLPLSIHGASRNILVKARTLSGMTKEIRLYSGYYAFIAGNRYYFPGLLPSKEFLGFDFLLFCLLKRGLGLSLD